MATKKSSKGTALGGWIDERIPGEPLPGDPPNRTISPLRGLLARHGIDADRFLLWLGPALGDYRFEMCVRDQMPARADMRNALRELRKRIRDLHGSLVELSPYALVAVQGRVGTNFNVGRMAADLAVLDPCVRAVEAAVAATTVRTGPKVATPRNELLKAVMAQLQQVTTPRIGKGKARELASKILELCGIDAPGDERTLRRIAR